MRQIDKKLKELGININEEAALLAPAFVQAYEAFTEAQEAGELDEKDLADMDSDLLEMFAKVHDFDEFEDEQEAKQMKKTAIQDAKIKKLEKEKDKLKLDADAKALKEKSDADAKALKEKSDADDKEAKVKADADKKKDEAEATKPVKISEPTKENILENLKENNTISRKIMIGIGIPINEEFSDYEEKFKYKGLTFRKTMSFYHVWQVSE